MREAPSTRVGISRAFAIGFAIFIACCSLVVRKSHQGFFTVHAEVIPSQTISGAIVERRGYVGDSACMPCHQQKAIPFSQTSHHLTSQLPGPGSILGSFHEGKNVLMIQDPSSTDVDPRLFFKMDIQHGDYYQTAVAEKGSQKFTRSERIDIVTGSGVRGQTYLYWAGNQLFELPVSYWMDGDQWVNSPGYKDGTANYSRHVDPRCLECHASYIKPLSTDPQTNVYDRESFVPGISCETCHGPGATHVERERSGSSKTSKPIDAAILNPRKFTRDRQVDLCGLCHSGGQRTGLTPAFTYTPGAPLDQFFAPDPGDAADRPDVHGNQVSLLKKSRCYISSPSMSCSTCHDVHAGERSAADYSNRCLKCHQWQSCGASHTLGAEIANNCIDCHMPMQQTSAIVSTTAGRGLHTSIRNHWIKVYPG
jgi:hypothetical protein